VGDGVATVWTIQLPFDGGFKFVQTEDLTEDGIAVTPEGAVIVPADVTISAQAIIVEYMGEQYTADIDDFAVGALTLNKVV
jgi:hypothetical protein